MSAASQAGAQTQQIETLILKHFRTEPFHNLPLIYGPSLESVVPGGTCSDKTLSFVAAGVKAGFDVSLHSGFIGGQEIHRLARVRIEDSLFFADVGNGWPALQLYPAEREVSYRCFGMGFRTEIARGRVTVFHEKRGRESLQLEIDVHSRPEAEIRAEIKGRFSSGVVYPFSNSLRFSLIVGNQFLFLRGDQLEIYNDADYECLTGIDHPQVPKVLHDYFGYDLRSLLRGCLRAPLGNGQGPITDQDAAPRDTNPAERTQVLKDDTRG
jgi:hypothetical protein